MFFSNELLLFSSLIKLMLLLLLLIEFMFVMLFDNKLKVEFKLFSKLNFTFLFDVFNFCKINKQNRQTVVEMMENQIKGDNITYLKLNKEMLLSCDDKGKK